jgi:hypothetical protein
MANEYIELIVFKQIEASGRGNLKLKDKPPQTPHAYRHVDRRVQGMPSSVLLVSIQKPRLLYKSNQQN